MQNQTPFISIVMVVKARLPQMGLLYNMKIQLDCQAFPVNLEANYKFDKSRVRFGWRYASGDDDPNDDGADNYEMN